MIKKFKLFESIEEVSLQNELANTIVDLYESENITAQNNFYDYNGEDLTFIFAILDFYKNENLVVIEYYKGEPDLLIHKYTDRDEDVLNNFIKYILNDYDEISYFSGGWAYDKIKLTNLPEIIEKLSVDNFEIWKNSNKYNL